MDNLNWANAGSSFPLPALRLLVPPLRLLSAAMWQVTERGDIMDYGKLEKFVTSVTETVPELLSARQKTQLILGLQTKLVLELCRSEQTAKLQTIQPHLDRIRAATPQPEETDSCEAEVEASESNFLALVQTLLRDPVERDHFFQHVFPVEYGLKYESALQGLMWEFLSRLEQLLPVPDLKQTASWLSAAPSVLDECVKSVSRSQQFITLLQHHRKLGHLDTYRTLSSSIGDCIFSSLSLPPSVEVVMATNQRDIEIQPEFMDDPVLYGEQMETESILVTDYTEVELGTTMYTSEGREVRIVYRTEAQRQIDNQAELDQKGLQGEHQGEEIELICEEVEDVDQDVDLVIEERSPVDTEVEVVSEEVRVVCEEVESMDREVEIMYEEEQHVKSEYEELVVCAENTNDRQYSNEEIINKEREVKKEEIERDEQERDAAGQIPKADPNQGNSNCGQPVGSDRGTSCLLHESTSEPPPVSSTSQPLRPNKALLRKLGSQTKRGHVMVLKSDSNVTWVVPLKLLPESPEKEEDTEVCSAGPINPPINGITGGVVEAPSLVFACSQCSFYHTDEVNLRQHLEDLHPEEFSRLLTAGENETETPPEPSSSKPVQQPSPNTPHTPGKSHKRTLRSKTCPVCGKTFSRAADMRRHQRSHTGERPYKCAQCGKTFQYSFDLKRHQRKGTGSRPFQCCLCVEGFDQEEELKGHCSMAHSADVPPAEDLESDQQNLGEEGQHKCPNCDMSFSQISQMERHQLIHSDDDPLRCSQCWKKCTNSDALTRHMQMHTGGQPYQCSVCKMNFSQLVCLRQHYLRSHKDEGSFLCSNCPKGFSRLSNLIKHQRTHTGERPYQCSHCPKRFTQLQILTRHERMHTGERPYLCSDCGKRFLSSGELSKHLQCHSEERPFPCSQCGKTFKANRFLKKHLQTHTGERPFPCSHCGKRFSKSTDLTRHNRMHTGERPHLCLQCGKSFLTYSEVVKHQRYHTGERPFKCAQCGKTFTQSCYLTVHQRIHTGERPYSCSVCDRRFNSTTPLRRHMLTHTGEKPFTCSECGKAYNRLHLLRTHEQTHVGNLC